MNALVDALKECDSWSETEDRGQRVRHGRYGVTIYFNTREDTEAFKKEVLRVSLGDYDRRF